MCVCVCGNWIEEIKTGEGMYIVGLQGFIAKKKYKKKGGRGRTVHGSLG